MSKRTYLDYASLTPIDPLVILEMKKFSAQEYANPSSLYKEGVAAKRALNEGRAKVASFINAHSDEIVFTSGGTEANVLAIEGAGKAAILAGIVKPHLIISVIEHSSIIETANIMEKEGFEVSRISVDANGVVLLEELKKAIKPNTFMVSIMTVNNEVGTIQPIREIAKIIRQARSLGPTSSLRSDLKNYPLFHTDAAQALCLELNVEKLGVDLLTLDSSKMYGPRGIGCLYVKRVILLEPTMYGGGQEKGLRSGTENIPAVKGFAKALEIIEKELKDGKMERLKDLRNTMIEVLKKINPLIMVSGARTEVSSHILNVSIPGIDNEFFILQLDANGIACSTKSSCLRDEDESYVLKAMGIDSKTSVRFSFGRWTRKTDIKKALKVIGWILVESGQ